MEAVDKNPPPSPAEARKKVHRAEVGGLQDWWSQFPLSDVDGGRSQTRCRDLQCEEEMRILQDRRREKVQQKD